MKVRTHRPDHARLPWRASVAALASALAALLGLFPTTAHAITRADVLHRAHTWVTKRITYSQTSHYGGYRRDCSGFVSMAWKLGRSYTSRTIHAVATRIPLSKLRPGDAVHTPGHVALFVKWANKAHTRYVAMEESTWGRPALHRVRSLGRAATALRYHRIKENPVAAVAAPLTGVSVLPTVPASDTLSVDGLLVVSAGSDTTAASVLVTQTAVASWFSDGASTLLLPSATQPAGAFALVPIY